MKIKLTESNLKQIVEESVKKVLKEGTSRCPDKFFGGYFFEGLGRDINGNPIYCSEHLPLEAKKMLGWRKSAKYGMRGQADNWRVCHVLDSLGLPRGNDDEEYYNSLDESVNKVLKESYGYDAYPQSGYEEFSRIGENYAYEVMKELCTKYKREDIDAECISRIVNQFKDVLWVLVEVGNEYAGIKGFGIKDSQYN
jgi:hypothetical protein